MEIPGKMQLTLVSYYGEKTKPALDLIRLCQDKLSAMLLSAFRPYELEQVHGTIIGLEGCRVGSLIRNDNFSSNRGEDRQMSPAELLRYLRSNEFPSFSIRVGGFRHYKDWGFVSRSQHPYLRSFSIHGSIAVAMGWPIEGDSFTDTLDKLRHKFNEINVLHKWHKKEGDKDNDFFFVLGHVDLRSISAVQLQGVQEEMRLFLAGLNDVIIPINKEVLSIVGYLDAHLPIETSCSFKTNDSQLNPERILHLYPDCGTAV